MDSYNHHQLFFFYTIEVGLFHYLKCLKRHKKDFVSVNIDSIIAPRDETNKLAFTQETWAIPISKSYKGFLGYLIC